MELTLLLSATLYACTCVSFLSFQTHGLGAGRKLRVLRRNQLWADKDYCKGADRFLYARTIDACVELAGSKESSPVEDVDDFPLTHVG